MAVTQQNNVIRIAADNDTLSGNYEVCSILYVPGTGTPTAQIKHTDTSGMVLWETAETTRHVDEVELRLTGTTHFDLAGTGTILYLYTKP